MFRLVFLAVFATNTTIPITNHDCYPLFSDYNEHMDFSAVTRSKKMLVVAAISALLLCATISATIVLGTRNKAPSGTSAATTSPTIALPNPLDPNQAPKDVSELTVLLLGYGGAGHQGGYLTDVIQIAHVNFKTKKVALISVPRDLWVTLPNGKSAKINSAFTLGEDPDKPIESGGIAAKQMIATVIGKPVNYYIATDFVSFKRIIGYGLEGITVQVPEVLDDPWYPITGKEQDPCGKTPEEIAQLTSQYSGFDLEKQFECRYEHVHFDPGAVTMQGDEALQFVRSRHGSSAGDFSRSARQQALLMAIKDKLLSLQALSNLPKYFSQLANHTTSDITLDIAQYLVPALSSSLDFSFVSIVLSTENVLQSGKSANGQYIIYPKSGQNNWTQTHEYIAKQIGGN